MVGIGDVSERRAGHLGARAHELGLQGRHRVDRIIVQITGQPLPAQAQPVMVKGQGIEFLPDLAKPMDIAVADGAPVDELDTQLERALGGADELVLVDFQGRVEVLDVRNRRFTHTDGADFVRFDQLDPVLIAEQFGQRRRRHPACRAASDDDDIERGRMGHSGLAVQLAAMKSACVGITATQRWITSRILLTNSSTSARGRWSTKGW